MAKKTLISLSAVLILTFVLSLSASLPRAPEALAKPTWSAQAQCSETGRSGTIKGAPSEVIAEIRAVKKCIANGGIDGCCKVKWVRPDGKTKTKN